MCGHTLEKIEAQLRCKVCEAFHSDMTLDWIDYIHKQAEVLNVQTKPKKFSETSWSRRGSTGHSKTSDTEDQD